MRLRAKTFREWDMRRTGGLRSLIGRAFGCWLLLAVPAALAGTPGEALVGEQLREAQMNGIAGGGAKLSSFRGKPLLINVWASWCGPCRDEMGSLERLAGRYAGREFAVIGISTDDDHAAAAGFSGNRASASPTISTAIWCSKTCSGRTVCRSLCWSTPTVA